MNVELPNTGCNILDGDSVVYNYSTDGHTRTKYTIYEGVAQMSSTSTSSYGYTYSGTCLVTGDLVYKPETEVYFTFIAGMMIGVALYIIYKIILERFLR